MVSRVVAADVRETPVEKRLPGIEYVQADVRSPGLIQLFDRFKVDNEAHALTSRWLMAALRLYRPQIEWASRVQWMAEPWRSAISR